VRIAAASVIEAVRRADSKWRPHDVCHLLGIHAPRLRELTRREDLTGLTWTFDEVHRLAVRQASSGTTEEREHAAAALKALREAQAEAVFGAGSVAAASPSIPAAATNR
jgi:hypothetical protein